MAEKILDRVRRSIHQRLEKRRHVTERRTLAGQLLNARYFQGHKIMEIATDRGMYQDMSDGGLEGYVDAFHGLTYFLDAVRKLGNTPTVLDIGAGTTRAVTQIAKSSLGVGLDFIATSVAYDKMIETDKGIGRDRFRVTSAEKLKGIEDNSIAAIISLAGFAYSDLPEKTIKRLDEVLVAGGLIKATFDNRERGEEYGMHRHHKFTKALREKGYDVAIRQVPSGMDVLVAVKPGRSDSFKAMDLLTRDWEDYKRSSQQLAA